MSSGCGGSDSKPAPAPRPELTVAGFHFDELKKHPKAWTAFNASVSVRIQVSNVLGAWKVTAITDKGGSC